MSNLTKHTMSSKKAKKFNPPVYSCQSCNVSFFKVSMLQAHIALHQDDESVLQTHIESNQDDESPQQSHVKLNQDDDSPQKSHTKLHQDNDSLQQLHEKLHQHSEFPQQAHAKLHQGNNSPQQSHVENHKLNAKMPEVGKKTIFLCQHPLCNTLCVDEESYEKHLQSHVNSRLSEQEACSTVGNNNQAVTKSKRKRKHLHSCRACDHCDDSSGRSTKKGGVAIGSMIQKKVANRKRQKRQHPSAPSSSVNKASKLKSHKVQNLVTSSSSYLNPVICPHCHIKMFAPMSLCMVHIRNHSESNSPQVGMYKNNILSSYSKKKALTFACTDCTQTFNSYEKLSKHAKSHVKGPIEVKLPKNQKSRLQNKSPTLKTQPDEENLQKTQSSNLQPDHSKNTVGSRMQLEQTPVIQSDHSSVVRSDSIGIRKLLETQGPDSQPDQLAIVAQNIRKLPNQITSEETRSSEIIPESALAQGSGNDSMPDLYKCPDSSCTFSTPISWEYHAHLVNIHDQSTTDVRNVSETKKLQQTVGQGLQPCSTNVVRNVSETKRLQKTCPNVQPANEMNKQQTASPNLQPDHSTNAERNIGEIENIQQTTSPNVHPVQSITVVRNISDVRQSQQAVTNVKPANLTNVVRANSVYTVVRAIDRPIQIAVESPSVVHFKPHAQLPGVKHVEPNHGVKQVIEQSVNESPTEKKASKVAEQSPVEVITIKEEPPDYDSTVSQLTGIKPSIESQPFGRVPSNSVGSQPMESMPCVESQVLGSSQSASLESQQFGRIPPITSTESQPFGRIPPSAGPESQPFGRIPPSASTESQPFGRIPPSAGTESQPFGRIPPSAGTESQPFGRIPPSASTESQPFGRIPPSASTESQPFGRIPPSASTESQPFGRIPPSASTESQPFGRIPPSPSASTESQPYGIIPKCAESQPLDSQPLGSSNNCKESLLIPSTVTKPQPVGNIQSGNKTVSQSLGISAERCYNPMTNQYNCPYTSCTFSSPSALEFHTHLSNMHFYQITPTGNTQPVILNIPDVSYRTRQAGTSSNYSSPSIQQDSRSPSKQPSPSSPTTYLFQCNVCKGNFDDYNSFYKSHLFKGKISGLACVHCKKTFHAYYLYMNHMQSHMVKVAESTQELTSPPPLITSPPPQMVSSPPQIVYPRPQMMSPPPQMVSPPPRIISPPPLRTYLPSTIIPPQVQSSIESLISSRGDYASRCTICNKRCFTKTDLCNHEKYCRKEMRRFSQEKSVVNISKSSPNVQFCKPCYTVFEELKSYHKHMSSVEHMNKQKIFYFERLQELNEKRAKAGNYIPYCAEQVCEPCRKSFDRMDLYYQHMVSGDHEIASFQYYVLAAHNEFGVDEEIDPKSTNQEDKQQKTKSNTASSKPETMKSQAEQSDMEDKVESEKGHLEFVSLGDGVSRWRVVEPEKELPVLSEERECVHATSHATEPSFTQTSSGNLQEGLKTSSDVQQSGLVSQPASHCAEVMTPSLKKSSDNSGNDGTSIQLMSNFQTNNRDKMVSNMDAEASSVSLIPSEPALPLRPFARFYNNILRMTKRSNKFSDADVGDFASHKWRQLSTDQMAELQKQYQEELIIYKKEKRLYDEYMLMHQPLETFSGQPQPSNPQKRQSKMTWREDIFSGQLRRLADNAGQKQVEKVPDSTQPLIRNTTSLQDPSLPVIVSVSSQQPRAQSIVESTSSCQMPPASQPMIVNAASLQESSTYTTKSVVASTSSFQQSSTTQSLVANTSSMNQPITNQPSIVNVSSVQQPSTTHSAVGNTSSIQPLIENVSSLQQPSTTQSLVGNTSSIKMSSANQPLIVNASSLQQPSVTPSVVGSTLSIQEPSANQPVMVTASSLQHTSTTSVEANTSPIQQYSMTQSVAQSIVASTSSIQASSTNEQLIINASSSLQPSRTASVVGNTSFQSPAVEQPMIGVSSLQPSTTTSLVANTSSIQGPTNQPLVVNAFSLLKPSTTPSVEDASFQKPSNTTHSLVMNTSSTKQPTVNQPSKSDTSSLQHQSTASSSVVLNTLTVQHPNTTPLILNSAPGNAFFQQSSTTPLIVNSASGNTDVQHPTTMPLILIQQQPVYMLVATSQQSQTISTASTGTTLQQAISMSNPVAANISTNFADASLAIDLNTENSNRSSSITIEERATDSEDQSKDPSTEKSDGNNTNELSKMHSAELSSVNDPNDASKIHSEELSVKDVCTTDVTHITSNVKYPSGTSLSSDNPPDRETISSKGTNFSDIAKSSSKTDIDSHKTLTSGKMVEPHLNIQYGNTITGDTITADSVPVTSSLEDDDDVIMLEELPHTKPTEVIDLTADDCCRRNNPQFHVADGIGLKPPKLPDSAYRRFYQEVYWSVRRQNEELSQTDIKKTIESMWRVLPAGEMQVYTKQFDEAVQKYNNELERYNWEMKRLRRENPRTNPGCYPTMPRGPDNVVVTNSGHVTRSIDPHSASLATVMKTVNPISASTRNRISSYVKGKVQNSTPMSRNMMQNEVGTTTSSSIVSAGTQVHNSTTISTSVQRYPTGKRNFSDRYVSAYTSMPKIPDPPLGPYTRFYSSGIITKLKQNHPNVHSWKLNKLAGQIWKNMTANERKPYVQEYERAKAQYNAAVARFNVHYEQWQKHEMRRWGPYLHQKKTQESFGNMQTTPDRVNNQSPILQERFSQSFKSKAPNVAGSEAAKVKSKPKRPKILTGYMRYSISMYRKLQEENPDLHFSSMGKLIGQKWRDLPEEEKNVYKKAYWAEKEKYMEEKLVKQSAMMESETAKDVISIISDGTMTYPANPGISPQTDVASGMASQSTSTSVMTPQSAISQQMTSQSTMRSGMMSLSANSPQMTSVYTNASGMISPTAIAPSVISPGMTSPSAISPGIRPQSAAASRMTTLPTITSVMSAQSAISPGINPQSAVSTWMTTQSSIASVNPSGVTTRITSDMSPQSAVASGTSPQPCRPPISTRITYGDSTAEEAILSMQNLFDAIGRPKPNSDLISADEVRNENFKCKFCGLILHSFESFTKHNSAHMNEHETTCDVCHRHFSSKKLLLQHQVSHQTDISSERKQFLYLPNFQKLSSTTQGFMCIYCLKTVRVEDVTTHATGCGIIVEDPNILESVPVKPSRVDSTLAGSDSSESGRCETQEGKDVGDKEENTDCDNDGVSRWEIVPGTSNTLHPVMSITSTESHDTPTDSWVNHYLQTDNRVLESINTAESCDTSQDSSTSYDPKTCQNPNVNNPVRSIKSAESHEASQKTWTNHEPLLLQRNDNIVADPAEKRTSLAPKMMRGTCVYCDQIIEYDHANEMHSHMVNCQAKLCPICKKTYNKRSIAKMKLHLATCVGQNSDVQFGDPICRTCNARFTSLRKLERHIEYYHTLHDLIKKSEVRARECALTESNSAPGFGIKQLHLKCPLCDLSIYFDEEIGMKLHLATCLGPFSNRPRPLKDNKAIYDFVCEYCNKNLSSESDLKSHVSKHSLQSLMTVFQCPVCDEKFRFERGFISHKRVHRKTLDCITHTALRNKLQAMCSNTNLTTKDCQNDNKAQSEVIDDPLGTQNLDALFMMCPHCDVNLPYTSDEELKSHLGTCNVLNEEKKKRMEDLRWRYSGTCEVCNTDFVFKVHLIKHVLCHTMEELMKSIICESCNQRFRTDIDMLEHKAYRCQIAVNSQVSEMVDEIRDQMNGSSHGAHHVACSHCDKEIYYNSESELRLHLTMCMSKNPEILQIKHMDQNRQSYTCQICLAHNAASEFTYEGIKHHAQTAHGMSVLLLVKQCKKCNSRFRTKEQLAIHTKKWQGRCDEPMRRIMISINEQLPRQDGSIPPEVSSQKDMSGTQMNENKRRKSMNCPHCIVDIIYDQIEDLQYHLATCVKGRSSLSPIEVCQICGEHYSEMEEMWDHAKTHMLSDLMSTRPWTLTLENRHLFVLPKTSQSTVTPGDDRNEDDTSDPVPPSPKKKRQRPEKDVVFLGPKWINVVKPVDMERCKPCVEASQYTNKVHNPHYCQYCQPVRIPFTKQSQQEKATKAKNHICLECPECQQRFANKERLGSHMLTHIKNYIIDGEELICIVCDYREVMTNLMCFANHVISHRTEGQSSDARSSPFAKDDGLRDQYGCSDVDLSIVKIEKLDEPINSSNSNVAQTSESSSLNSCENSTNSNVAQTSESSLNSSENLGSRAIDTTASGVEAYNRREIMPDIPERLKSTDMEEQMKEKVAPQSEMIVAGGTKRKVDDGCEDVVARVHKSTESNEVYKESEMNEVFMTNESSDQAHSKEMVDYVIHDSSNADRSEGFDRVFIEEADKIDSSSEYSRGDGTVFGEKEIQTMQVVDVQSGKELSFGFVVDKIIDNQCAEMYNLAKTAEVGELENESPAGVTDDDECGVHDIGGAFVMEYSGNEMESNLKPYGHTTLQTCASEVCLDDTAKKPYHPPNPIDNKAPGDETEKTKVEGECDANIRSIVNVSTNPICTTNPNSIIPSNPASTTCMIFANHRASYVSYDTACSTAVCVDTNNKQDFANIDENEHDGVDSVESDGWNDVKDHDYYKKDKKGRQPLSLERNIENDASEGVFFEGALRDHTYTSLRKRTGSKQEHMKMFDLIVLQESDKLDKQEGKEKQTDHKGGKTEGMKEVPMQLENKEDERQRPSGIHDNLLEKKGLPGTDGESNLEKQNDDKGRKGEERKEISDHLENKDELHKESSSSIHDDLFAKGRLPANDHDFDLEKQTEGWTMEEMKEISIVENQKENGQANSLDLRRLPKKGEDTDLVEGHSGQSHQTKCNTLEKAQVKDPLLPSSLSQAKTGACSTIMKHKIAQNIESRAVKLGTMPESNAHVEETEANTGHSKSAFQDLLTNVENWKKGNPNSQVDLSRMPEKSVCYRCDAVYDVIKGHTCNAVPIKLNEDAYSCPICGEDRVYTRRSNCAAHIRNNHGIEPIGHLMHIERFKDHFMKHTGVGHGQFQMPVISNVKSLSTLVPGSGSEVDAGNSTQEQMKRTDCIEEGFKQSGEHDKQGGNEKRTGYKGGEIEGMIEISNQLEYKKHKDLLDEERFPDNDRDIGLENKDEECHNLSSKTHDLLDDYADKTANTGHSKSSLQELVNISENVEFWKTGNQIVQEPSRRQQVEPSRRPQKQMSMCPSCDAIFDISKGHRCDVLPIKLNEFAFCCPICGVKKTYTQHYRCVRHINRYHQYEIEPRQKCLIDEGGLNKKMERQLMKLGRHGQFQMPVISNVKSSSATILGSGSEMDAGKSIMPVISGVKLLSATDQRLASETNVSRNAVPLVPVVEIHDPTPVCLFCGSRHDIEEKCSTVSPQNKEPKCPFCERHHGIEKRCESLVNYLDCLSPGSGLSAPQNIALVNQRAHASLPSTILNKQTSQSTSSQHANPAVVPYRSLSTEDPEIYKTSSGNPTDKDRKNPFTQKELQVIEFMTDEKKKILDHGQSRTQAVTCSLENEDKKTIGQSGEVCTDDIEIVDMTSSEGNMQNRDGRNRDLAGCSNAVFEDPLNPSMQLDRNPLEDLQRHKNLNKNRRSGETLDSCIEIVGDSLGDKQRDGCSRETLDSSNMFGRNMLRDLQGHYINVNRYTVGNDFFNMIVDSKWSPSLVYDDETDASTTRCPFCYESHSRPHVCSPTIVYIATFGKYKPIKMGDGSKDVFMCPVCYDSFPWDYNCRAHTFAKHINSLKNSDVTISLKSSMIPVQIGKNMFACSLCSFTCTTYKDCRRHVYYCMSKRREKNASTKAGYRCPFCPEVHTRPYNCRYHIRKQHTRCEPPGDEPIKLEHERFLCPVCSNVFVRESSCRKHILSRHQAHDKQFCEVCRVVYASNENHQCLAVPIKDKTANYRCPYCEKVFTRSYTCSLHIREKHANDANPNEPDPQNEPDLHQPMSKTQQQNIDLDYAQLIFANINSTKDMNSHCFECGQNINGEQRHVCLQLKCPHCKLTFPVRSELMKHIITSHKLTVEEDASVDKQKEVQQLTKAADFYIKSRSNDETHDKRPKCPHCKALFWKRSQLMEHILANHKLIVDPVNQSGVTPEGADDNRNKVAQELFKATDFLPDVKPHSDEASGEAVQQILFQDQLQDAPSKRLTSGDPVEHPSQTSRDCFESGTVSKTSADQFETTHNSNLKSPFQTSGDLFTSGNSFKTSEHANDVNPNEPNSQNEPNPHPPVSKTQQQIVDLDYAQRIFANMISTKDMNSHCFECGKNTNGEQRHVCIHPKCPHCKLIFPVRSELMKHILTNHKLTVDSSDQSGNNQEDTSGEKQKEVQKLTKAADFYIKSRSNDETQDKRPKCPHCKAMFWKRSQLMEHILANHKLIVDPVNQSGKKSGNVSKTSEDQFETTHGSVSLLKSPFQTSGELSKSGNSFKTSKDQLDTTQDSSLAKEDSSGCSNSLHQDGLPIIESVYSQQCGIQENVGSYVNQDIDQDDMDTLEEVQSEEMFLQEESEFPYCIEMESDEDDIDSDLEEDISPEYELHMKDLEQMAEDMEGPQPVIVKLKTELRELAGVYKEMEQSTDLPSSDEQRICPVLKQKIANVVSEAVMTGKELMTMYEESDKQDGGILEEISLPRVDEIKKETESILDTKIDVAIPLRKDELDLSNSHDGKIDRLLQTNYLSDEITSGGQSYSAYALVPSIPNQGSASPNCTVTSVNLPSQRTAPSAINNQGYQGSLNETAIPVHVRIPTAPSIINKQGIQESPNGNAIPVCIRTSHGTNLANETKASVTPGSLSSNIPTIIPTSVVSGPVKFVLDIPMEQINQPSKRKLFDTESSPDGIGNSSPHKCMKVYHGTSNQDKPCMKLSTSTPDLASNPAEPSNLGPSTSDSIVDPQIQYQQYHDDDDDLPSPIKKYGKAAYLSVNGGLLKMAIDEDQRSQGKVQMSSGLMKAKVWCPDREAVSRNRKKGASKKKKRKSHGASSIHHQPLGNQAQSASDWNRPTHHPSHGASSMHHQPLGNQAQSASDWNRPTHHPSHGTSSIHHQTLGNQAQSASDLNRPTHHPRHGASSIHHQPLGNQAQSVSDLNQPTHHPSHGGSSIHHQPLGNQAQSVSDLNQPTHHPSLATITVKEFLLLKKKKNATSPDGTSLMQHPPHGTGNPNLTTISLRQPTGNPNSTVSVSQPTGNSSQLTNPCNENPLSREMHVHTSKVLPTQHGNTIGQASVIGVIGQKIISINQQRTSEVVSSVEQTCNSSQETINIPQTNLTVEPSCPINSQSQPALIWDKIQVKLCSSTGKPSRLGQTICDPSQPAVISGESQVQLDLPTAKPIDSDSNQTKPSQVTHYSSQMAEVHLSKPVERFTDITTTQCQTSNLQSLSTSSPVQPINSTRENSAVSESSLDATNESRPQTALCDEPSSKETPKMDSLLTGLLTSQITNPYAQAIKSKTDDTSKPSNNVSLPSAKVTKHAHTIKPKSGGTQSGSCNNVSLPTAKVTKHDAQAIKPKYVNTMSNSSNNVSLPSANVTKHDSQSIKPKYVDTMSGSSNNGESKGATPESSGNEEIGGWEEPCSSQQMAAHLVEQSWKIGQIVKSVSEK